MTPAKAKVQPYNAHASLATAQDVADMLTGALRYCNEHQLHHSRITYTWRPVGRDLVTVDITVAAP